MPMTKPLLLRLAPNCFKEAVYYRYFNRRYANWHHLYKAARLTACPNVHMYDLVLGDVISGMLAFNGFYERELTKQIAHRAAAGGLLVDVGANMGYFSLLWTGINASNRAVAFEPSPRNIRLLDNNAVKNSLQDRITLMPKAVGSHCGSITFDVGPVQQTGWGEISAAESETNITVPITRLDEEMPEAEIAVLKIDVQGTDTQVLFGSENLLKQKRIRVIYYEQDGEKMEAFGVKAGEAEAFLQGLGYKCVPIFADCGEWSAFPASSE
jgi:FkbM family methyltransferase